MNNKGTEYNKSECDTLHLSLSTEQPFHQEWFLGFNALKYYTYFDWESVIYKKWLVHYESIPMFSYVDDFCQLLILHLVTTKSVKAVSQYISLEISSQQNTQLDS